MKTDAIRNGPGSRSARPRKPGSRGLWLAGFLALLALAGPLPALADGAVATQPQVEVALISAQTAVGQARQIRLGLHFTLAKGWKTYWRSPGDAGYPIAVDWAGSGNLAKADLLWPAPHRFTLFGLDTFGYKDEVVLPVIATLSEPGKPLSIKAHLRYLVCETVCIPYEADLALEIPAGDALPSAQAQLIDRYYAQVPGDGRAQGLTLEQVALAGSDAKPSLEVTARSSLAEFAAPDLIVEAPPGLYFGKPDIQLGDNDKLARFTLPITREATAPALSGATVIVTLTDGIRGLERNVTLTRAAGSGENFSGLLAIVGVALLGGLLLNLMPCVLPVLSLKLLGVAGHGGGEKAHVRLSFLVSAAGVLAAFLLLAAMLAALDAAGLAIGWGIQFQQPLFLAAMALIVTLFAANLMGWFEITLPGWLGSLASDADAAAGRAADRRSLPGYFLTGMLATLLATPCSAPFVGTAVSFALSRGALEIFVIFGAMGLGLALPYLAVAALPGIAVALPRPGRWMIHLRRLLGIALAATAAWLLSVLAGDIGIWGVAILGGLLLAMALALALLHRLPVDKRPLLWGGAAALGIAALALPALISSGPTAQARTQAQAGLAEGWAPFEEARIGALVAQGRTVIVDVTADWCITCLANKTLVLDRPEMKAAFESGKVVTMRADWTRPDEAISRYLARFGRYGIPFNVVYGPKAPEGILLPELLSRDAVLDAIARAGS
ncbi:suppressor for copper-sensitivity B [Hypericibacter terrae]|uniref:Suppressor for copper-sensitivity B n=1 Tax=Hypericibacter terrae TaxID=2602015 RepID=A0A5J6MDL3_9PROT|nr:protein-disulfide reductase DsbD domain-containing protein [Hypericibacter terrae]QEX15509.1 suppressor for copper-sensitivity B [Hypericibacter terrae]